MCVHSPCLYGSTALVDLGRFFSFLIYTQSIRLLGWGISPSQGRYRHRINAYTDIHVSSGIRTQDPSVRAGEDSSCLRPRGHCEQLVHRSIFFNEECNLKVSTYCWNQAVLTHSILQAIAINGWSNSKAPCCSCRYSVRRSFYNWAKIKLIKIVL
jgi:hypothetical protein